MDIYVFQPPDLCVTAKDRDNCEGYLSDLSRYYRFGLSITVHDINDFIVKLNAMAVMNEASIKNLIIGSHGAGGRYAWFRIGNEQIDNGTLKDQIPSLKRVAPLFTKDANVYILACHTGTSQTLLKRVSNALGGVTVHGYTGRIEVDGGTVDMGRDGEHTVCVRDKCTTDKDFRPPVRADDPKIPSIPILPRAS